MGLPYETRLGPVKYDGSRVTKKSKSLATLVWLRETDPKMRILEAPYWFPKRIIWFRCVRNFLSDIHDHHLNCVCGKITYFIYWGKRWRFAGPLRDQADSFLTHYRQPLLEGGQRPLTGNAVGCQRPVGFPLAIWAF